MKICEYCGNEFDGKPLSAYCSQDCLNQACNISSAKTKCKTCGREFETMTDALYCSFECAYHLNDGIETVLP